MIRKFLVALYRAAHQRLNKSFALYIAVYINALYKQILQKRNLLCLFFNVGDWKTDWVALII